MKGFVDLQVNGYLGVDFSAPGLTLNSVRQVTNELRDRGTVAYCPTVITSSPTVYRENLPVLAQACRDPELSPHLLGVHLEGPFISSKEGARGAHSAKHTRAPDIDLYEELRELADGQVSLVTLAPELPGAEELVRYIRRSGVTVSLGHHLADRAVIREACKWGVSATTHLGNGIPNLLPRHPNPLWDQLDEDGLTAMLITDGHHVPDVFIRVVARVKGPSQTIVVSDAAPVAGLPPGQYETLGQTAVLEESGKLWNPEGDHLVGSSSSMLDCMNYLADLGIFGEKDLWRVGISNPLSLVEKSLRQESFRDLPDLIFDGARFSLAR